MTDVDAHWVYVSAFLGLLNGVFFWPTIVGPRWQIITPMTGLLIAACATIIWQAQEKSQ